MGEILEIASFMRLHLAPFWRLPPSQRSIFRPVGSQRLRTASCEACVLSHGGLSQALRGHHASIGCPMSIKPKTT